MTANKWKVGVLLFDQVDAFDFVAPMEIFSVTTYTDEDSFKMMKNTMDSVEHPFEVRTVSWNGESVRASCGLQISTDYSFTNAPEFDIILVPGAFGQHIMKAMRDKNLTSWLNERVATTPLVLSVCTGSLLLARTGILDGRKATSNLLALDFLQNYFPKVTVIRDKKVVDEEKVITSQGPYAGMKLGLFVVEKLLGSQVAKRTALSIEYDETL